MIAYKLLKQISHDNISNNLMLLVAVHQVQIHCMNCWLCSLICILLGTVYLQTKEPLLVVSGFCVYSVASAIFMFPALHNYYIKALEVRGYHIHCMCNAVSLQDSLYIIYTWYKLTWMMPWRLQCIECSIFNIEHSILSLQHSFPSTEFSIPKTKCSSSSRTSSQPLCGQL